MATPNYYKKPPNSKNKPTDIRSLLDSKGEAAENYVVEGALVKCSFGSKQVKIDPKKNWHATQQKMRIVDEMDIDIAIPSFGLCKAFDPLAKNPINLDSLKAAGLSLTMPKNLPKGWGKPGFVCPGRHLNIPWQDIKKDVSYEKKRAVKYSSWTVCQLAFGIVEFATDGQRLSNISGLTDEELLTLFANPSASLYLTPGVTDDALAYLERALLKNNGKIQLSGLSPQKNPNDYLIMIVFQKLIPPAENSGFFDESTFSGINGMYQNVTGKSEDLQTYITLDSEMLNVLKKYVKQCEKEIAKHPQGQMALGQKYGAGAGMVAEGLIALATGAVLYKGQLKTTDADLLEKDIREGEIGQANRQGEQRANVEKNIAETRAGVNAAGYNEWEQNVAKPAIEKVNSLSVEDLLSNATPGRVTKGKTTQYVKSGGFNEAVADFDSLYLTNVKKISTSYGTGKRGVLSDGRTVVVRSGSSDGRPTLEIRKPNGRGIEIRYEP